MDAVSGSHLIRFGMNESLSRLGSERNRLTATRLVGKLLVGKLDHARLRLNDSGAARPGRDSAKFSKRGSAALFFFFFSLHINYGSAGWVPVPAGCPAIHAAAATAAAASAVPAAS